MNSNLIPVPQLSKVTGISQDYIIEYTSKISAFDPNDLSDPSKSPLERVAAAFIEQPIQKYTDRYPSTKYRDVITDKNHKSVARLDEIAEESNKKYTNPINFTELDFKLMINEVMVLIYGKGFEYYKDVLKQD